MQRVTLTAFMVFGVWLSFGQTARFGDLNRNSVVVTSAPPQSVVSVNGQTGSVVVTAAGLGAATTQQVAAAAAAKLDAASPAAGLRADWVAGVPGYEDVGHLKIYDPLNYDENALFLGPLGFGQITHEDPNYPIGIDRFVLWSDLSTLPDIVIATNAIVQHVAEAIAAIPVPDLSSRVAVQSGHATNLAVSGWLALPQSQPTNLLMRLVSSNDVIMAIGVTQ